VEEKRDKKARKKEERIKRREEERKEKEVGSIWSCMPTVSWMTDLCLYSQSWRSLNWNA